MSVSPPLRSPKTNAERQADWRARHMFDGKLEANIKNRRMNDRRRYLAERRAKRWEGMTKGHPLRRLLGRAARGLPGVELEDAAGALAVDREPVHVHGHVVVAQISLSTRVAGAPDLRGPFVAVRAGGFVGRRSEPEPGPVDRDAAGETRRHAVGTAGPLSSTGGAGVPEHGLVIHSRGPWETPPRLVVGARCTCQRWSTAYTCLQLAEEGAEEAWPLAEALLRDDHDRHLHDVLARRALTAGKDASFY